MNLMRDFTQGGLVTKMRNGIGDAIALSRTTSYRQAVLQTELAFFATLPPTVIYFHVGAWLLVQNMRQFRKFKLGFMRNGETQVHNIVANRMSIASWCMFDLGG